MLAFTRRRLRRFGLVVATAGALAALAPGASADITGTVVSGAGAPLTGVAVRAVDATGQSVTSAYTGGTGTYNLYISTYSPPAFPLTVTYSYDDPCLPYGSAALTAAQAAGADGAVLPAIGLAARELCPASSYSFSSTAPAPTAYVDTTGGRVISGAGGIAYLRLAIPFGATGLTVLYNGAPIGGAVPPASGYYAQITAPATGGSGTLTANYAVDGTPISRTLGTMVVIGAIAAPPATSAGVDVEVVIDISGSMSGTDPQFLRKDAMRALLGLVGKNDRLGAVGFDDKFEPVFDLQGVTDANSGALASLADQHILDRGGTDYNVAFSKGYEALTLPAVYDAARPKYVIFLTDGAHNASDYNNGHLLMSANATGRPWPVCAVQLGTQFQAADVERLKRIASRDRRPVRDRDVEHGAHRRLPALPGRRDEPAHDRRHERQLQDGRQVQDDLEEARGHDQRREVLRELHAGRQADPGADRPEGRQAHAGLARQERRLPPQRNVLPVQGAASEEGHVVGRDDSAAARQGRARRAGERDGAAEVASSA